MALSTGLDMGGSALARPLGTTAPTGGLDASGGAAGTVPTSYLGGTTAAAPAGAGTLAPPTDPTFSSPYGPTPSGGVGTTSQMQGGGYSVGGGAGSGMVGYGTQQPAAWNPNDPAMQQMQNQATGVLNQPGTNFDPNQAQNLQTTYNGGPAVNTQQFDPARMPVSSVGQADPYFQKASDAYYEQAASRLDPQWQKTQQGLESQLMAQGLTRGSQAWNSALAEMNRSKTDAYGAATRNSILTGGAEGQRMQGMDIASGNFANAAEQQNYQNQLQGQQAYNAAQGQANQQGLQAGQFANQALTAEDQSRQAYGALGNQQYATQAGLASNLAGQEAQRYGTQQAYQTGLGNQAASRYGSEQSRLGAEAQAGATLGAAGYNASASMYNADQARQAQMYGYDTQRYGTDVNANTARYNTQAGVYNNQYNTNASYDLGMTNAGINQQYANQQGQQMNFNNAQTNYWRPIQTQNALGGTAVGNPTFPSVPSPTGGSPPPYVPPGYVLNAQGNYVQSGANLGGSLVGGLDLTGGH